MYNFDDVLKLSKLDRQAIYEEAADPLGTVPAYVEKDFWVCLVLETLYNKIPEGHPRLMFKGGTALSKAFNLINRFSEDIDLVVSREDLGFSDDRDPTSSGTLSNKARKSLFEELRVESSKYIHGNLRAALVDLLPKGCNVIPDETDASQQTLLIEYPTLYSASDQSYVLPRVKLEAGARSALEPNERTSVRPYIADILDDGSALDVSNILVINPSRTYLEKLLILHGIHCGFRDEQRKPDVGDRVSRHYYDVAMMTGTEPGQKALADRELLDSVREHHLVAFKQAWKKFDEALPGSLKVVPQDDVLNVIKEDYEAMQGMMFGEAPELDWIVEQLHIAEEAVNLEVAATPAI